MSRPSLVGWEAAMPTAARAAFAVLAATSGREKCKGADEGKEEVV